MILQLENEVLRLSDEREEQVAASRNESGSESRCDMFSSSQGQEHINANFYKSCKNVTSEFICGQLKEISLRTVVTWNLLKPNF